MPSKASTHAGRYREIKVSSHLNEDREGTCMCKLLPALSGEARLKGTKYSSVFPQNTKKAQKGFL